VGFLHHGVPVAPAIAWVRKVPNDCAGLAAGENDVCVEGCTLPGRSGCGSGCDMSVRDTVANFEIKDPNDY
jgi:hypothetical protein